MKRDWSQYNEELVKRGDKHKTLFWIQIDVGQRPASICGGMVNDGVQKAISQQ